jgi:D-lactate dehydrogenase
MKIVVFSTRSYDRRFLDAANRAEGNRHELTYLEARLTEQSVRLAEGAEGVCLVVNDNGSHEVLAVLAELGTRLVVLRSAGFNHIDLAAARDLKISVGRVPAYSPHAVAEHAVALILSLNRKIHRAYSRVREGNFALDGLLGFDIAASTVGMVHRLSCR